MSITSHLTTSDPIIRCFRQWLEVADFTDNEAGAGFALLERALPGGSVMLGWKAEVEEAFAGGDQALLSIGNDGESDESWFTAGIGGNRFIQSDGAVAGSAPPANHAFVAFDTTLLVWINAGSDFAPVSSGRMLITIMYVGTDDAPVVPLGG